MHYRKEIDGLRAVAVIPVILFHAGIWGFSGGFVGVDIFFVISGYLITSIILEEKRKNTFSIISFYERRVRRILPALSIVLITTTLGAYILMPADLLRLYSQSLISVTTFSSNIYFYLTSGYFSTVSDEKPLLHTWSLAVEEQYYLFFPVLIALLWSRGKKWLLSSLLFIAVLSLLSAHYLSAMNAVDANFYLIFSRAWELFFGSIIAFMPLHNIKISHWQREVGSLLGFALITYSVFSFNKETPFPSAWALFPVLGACFIIVYANSTSTVGGLLSSKILVAVGLISYSLYLWHQPLFAFLRLKSIGEPSDLKFVVAIFGAFALALLTWHYIEKPFRNKSRINKTKIFQFSAVSTVVFLTIGWQGHINHGFGQRFSAHAYSPSIQHSPMREACHTEGENYLKPEDACKYFSQRVTWASFGDSHTVEPAYSLARRLDNIGLGLLQLSFSGCAPALLFEVKEPGCSKWINESLIYLEKSDTIKHVLLGFRYSSFLYGHQLDDYPKLPNISPKQYFTEAYKNKLPEDLREIYWNSFKEIVNRLLAAGKYVHILYPIPELPVDISTAVTPFSIFGQGTMLDLNRATSAEYYFSRNKYILDKLKSLPYGSQLHAVNPFELLCRDKFCPAVIDGNALYFDDDHLSVSGANIVVSAIAL